MNWSSLPRLYTASLAALTHSSFRCLPACKARPRKINLITFYYNSFINTDNPMI